MSEIESKTQRNASKVGFSLKKTLNFKTLTKSYAFMKFCSTSSTWCDRLIFDMFEIVNLKVKISHKSNILTRKSNTNFGSVQTSSFDFRTFPRPEKVYKNTSEPKKTRYPWISIACTLLKGSAFEALWSFFSRFLTFWHIHRLGMQFLNFHCYCFKSCFLDFRAFPRSAKVYQNRSEPPPKKRVFRKFRWPVLC